MADALCGPSNSLQALQKHVSTDKTFQQDRVFTQRSPLEGFRSSQGFISGVLDAEFEAFQASQPSGNEAFGRDFLNSDAAAHPAVRDSNDHQLPSWALDFQALQVDEHRPSPIFSSQFREKAPLQLNFQKGRHPEFARQKPHVLAPQEPQRKSRFSGTLGRTHQTNYNHLNQPYNPFNPFPTQTLPNTESNYQARESFDDDAFQLAFDAAEQSFGDSAEYTQQEFPVRTQNALMNSNPEISASGLESPGSQQNQERSNGPLESTSESQHGVHDADGLARTAGELLDKVKHDSNPKFQKSTFMSLMRQLRDREVHVEGDRIVNTAHPLHPGGEFYPHTSIEINRDDEESLNINTMMTGAIYTDRLEA